MTVAAVILATSAGSALADAAGVPRVRRIADAAWSGGALPIVVVAPDPDGTVAAALGGTVATLTSPAQDEAGPVGQIVRGVRAAALEVSETTGALVWPVRFSWVGPEATTSLIEAHGRTPELLLRPSFHGEAGWPALLPVAVMAALQGLTAALVPDDVLAALIESGLGLRLVELGDPGTVLDGSTPREQLPAYEGPADFSGSMDWGAAVDAAGDAVHGTALRDKD